MRHTRTLAAVAVALLALAATASDAQARHRVYHPTVGRFMQRDPLGTPNESPLTRNLSSHEFTRRDPVAQYRDGMNLYQYVHSSPSRGVDPHGLKLRLSSLNSEAANEQYMREMWKIAQGCIAVYRKRDHLLGLRHGWTVHYKNPKSTPECECRCCWKILKALIDNANTVTLKASTEENDPTFKEGGPRYSPSRNRVYLNPGVDFPHPDPLVTGAGRNSVRSDIALAHELIHAVRDLEGRLVKDRRREEDTTIGLMGYADPLCTENKCRDELNHPRRYLH